MHQSTNQLVLGVVLAVAGALCFSTKAIFVKLGYLYEVEAVPLLAIRMLTSLPFFVFSAIFQERKGHIRKPIELKYWIGLFIAAGLGYYLSSYLDFQGLRFIDAGLERLILFTYPTFVVLLGAWLLKTRITRSMWLAITISYVGLFIIFADQLNDINLNSQFWKGSVFILVCAISFALYLILSQWLIPHFGVRSFTNYSMILATAMIFIHFISQYKLNQLVHYPKQVYWIGIGIAVVSTVIPAYMVNYAIQILGAARTAIIASIGPLSTIVLAYLVLGESLAWIHGLGGLFILAGVTLVTWQRKKTVRLNRNQLR